MEREAVLSMRKRGRVGGLLLSAAAGLLLLSGCDKKTTLYSQLEERQANTVMAALLDSGIGCEKVAGEEGTWNVLIADRNFARAASLLEQKGLPRRTYHGVADVFKKTGMVSSPSEERIRFVEALAQDLSCTIAQIEGVIDARVHVVLPGNNPFAKNVQPSSAAVAIRHRHNVQMASQIPQIKSLVMNSIEGLAYDKITVTLFGDAPEGDGLVAVEDKSPLLSAELLRILAAANAALLVALVALVVAVYARWRRGRAADARATAEEGAR